MSLAYWSQWGHAEIMSMHGVELDEVDADMCHDEYDIDLCQDDLEEASCCSNGCMDCLGLSNRDFM